VSQHDREPGETGTEQANEPASTEETSTGRERRRTRTRGARAGRGRRAADTTSASAAPAEPDQDGLVTDDDVEREDRAAADPRHTEAADDGAAEEAAANDDDTGEAADLRAGTDGAADEAADEAADDRAGIDDTGERASQPSSGDPDGDGEPGDDGAGAARRRRRRGRRGRGRGRGRGGADAGDDAVDDGLTAGTSERIDAATSDDEAAEDEEHGAGAAGRSGRRSRRRSAGGRGRGERTGADRTGTDRPAEDRGAARDDDAGGDALDDDDDEDVEKAIARSGTRVAAKRGRRATNGGNGGRRSAQRPGGVPEEVRRAILEGPPRTMLVTAKQDRTQIAVLEDRTVVEHYVTRKQDVTFVGNIYMARVQNVLPGMEAAFLDIGKGRNGVLYAGEVLYDELDLEEDADERIENALKPGQKVLVQVTKDPMGSKGPRLTMHLSLAGRYMVLAPNSELFGISRKLTDQERDRLRRVVKKVKPDDHGLIVRTAAEGASDEQLTADLERLLAKWARVEEAAKDAKALTTVYEEPALVVKVIRDNFGPEFERCIVDDEDLYHQVRGYLDEVAPELLDKVELYGQPTLDAQARAVGAPSAEVVTTSGQGDAADTQPAPAGADGDEVAATAAGTSPDAGSGDQDAPPPDAGTEPATEDRPGASDEVTASAGDDRSDATEDAGAEALAALVPAGGLTAEQLAAARERQQHLPPLFEAYDVADQLRKAMGKKVWLPSGGYLIIESTEAMKVIDVNTGKFTGGKDTNLEEVVLKTNLEAADEIVRQLRLRDMGGIIIIDFIDMLLKANQEQVVRRLKRELLRDRTKTRVSEVSRLGLVQMTRKNVSQGLIESFSHTCEACEGRGIISELD
jgi:Ribonuclease G/E